jgi:hypothetical protein
MRQRKRLLKRLAVIDSRLAQIQKAGAAIKRHCNASPDEIRAEAEKHAKHLRDQEAVKLGAKFFLGGGNLEKILKR